jgi:acyl carrier protein
MTLTMAKPALDTREQESCDVRGLIEAKFKEVAAAQGKALAPLANDTILLDSGLDSLCFAIIVATLEDDLGYDPFTEAEDVFFPVTFGDFVKFYERGR